MTQSRSEHPDTPHARTLEALPWLVNGSADHPDLVEARAHLARCSECQEWHAFDHALAGHLRETPIVDPAPHAAFASFIQRLDEDESRRRRRRLWIAPLAAFSRRVSVRNMPLIVALQAFVIAGLGIAFVMRPVERNQAATTGEYRTLSSTPEVSGADAGTRLRLVVDEHMTTGELAALLESVPARIVDGPSELGVFTIEVAAAPGASAHPDALALAKQLRSSPGVRFAEPTNGTRMEH